ncbi:hypothetical protein [Desulfitobacterium metallireducens]|uniref:Uncharacterized protein n=1 Tax=Desulfitobacterium metallireducens DSM 15288 TaxID=871968 RepID=W0ECS1_9FIRM|nr:hypothetical protein [Desulfitobacterium metallireducens]AHF06866.1 hypothetical protein DESME_07150 [Desulfitobacterium metallireducens DSM 15288]
MRAQITLTSSESKRLIAKGVKALPAMQKALAEHTIILAGGTTNAFLAEEILGIRIDEKSTYTVGIISEGKTGVSAEKKQIHPFIISKGKALRSDVHWKEYLTKLEPGDLFIKGGNAVDHTGLAAVAASNLTGGTIGAAEGTLYVRGIELIVPIGLEKLVPDVREAVEFMSGHRPDEAIGDKIGLIPMFGATVVTEITALEALFPVHAKCIASGGVNGSEGAITLVMDGEDATVKNALELIHSIKGEPAVK